MLFLTSYSNNMGSPSYFNLFRRLKCMSSKFSNPGRQIDLHSKEKEKQLTQRTSLLSVKNLPTHQKGNFASDGSQSLSIPFPNSIKKKKDESSL